MQSASAACLSVAGFEPLSRKRDALRYPDKDVQACFQATRVYEMGTARLGVAPPRHLLGMEGLSIPPVTALREKVKNDPKPKAAQGNPGRLKMLVSGWAFYISVCDCSEFTRGWRTWVSKDRRHLAVLASKRLLCSARLGLVLAPNGSGLERIGKKHMYRESSGVRKKKVTIT